MENQVLRSSTMQRSQLPRPGSVFGLTELSDSQSNSRLPPSNRPPPSKIGIPKRETPQPVYQPEPKRKAHERAGEYPEQPPAAGINAVPRPNGHVKGQSLSSFKNLYSSRHTSGPPSSAISRQTSSSSFASSVGPGRFAPSDRPKTAASNNRSLYGRPKTASASASATARPHTAYGNRAEDDYYVEGTGHTALDVNEKLGEVDDQIRQMKEFIDTSLSDRKAADETLEWQRKRTSEVEAERDRLDGRNQTLQANLDSLKERFQQLTFDLETERRNHKYELEDESRRHRRELEELRKELEEETERLQKSHREAMEALDRHYRVELEDERSIKSREVEELRLKLGNEQQDLHLALQKKDRDLSEMRSQLEAWKGDLDREQALRKNLDGSISELAASNVTLEAKINSLKSQVEFLESDSKAQSDSFASMEARLQEALRVAEEARQKLIKEETERRILFNKYQELKGNIRVMCRVRPMLGPGDGEGAKITFPDDKTWAEIAVQGAEEMSSLGKVTRKNFNFEFDRVFAPGAANQDVFDEISQLVQSALDGYNVCIFCYGQTGSGKTHTMSSRDGMIPRATHMIYETISKLKEKSWTYTMEGSFIEVYNEELHDLLSPHGRESAGSAAGAGQQAKKLEIRHDEARKQTTVTNCKTVELDSADKVEAMLEQASANRAVAATKSNERSSRSHSVFILKLVGHNKATGERCEGTLNLVDLAGSERLKQSGAEGERMKETQSINKSLACLGDVIEALGRGSGHVPYRNSKLTHLLQYSLGGNSKTLMFVMVSPLEVHLKETLTSLRFATKVHNTHIGTAKATKKVSA
ncbi:kinesin-domain-containing protein [Sodiomyces alkalinus F11]|uniref:Kinesin-like protein n=1 Tax=Sodiomyces alkalinus (strain CBS 110278 / VKM F-3762 / F11) TaxID=1314773 RepID=A0A3N2PZD7_SODAK|nr:kinesin-domain-containing protein [Sodiomyces alkalinus F11]ROT39889.1 kinesin-domain-containing protein [Sodiomyces alkalinus F11]